jgi:hypothetical protein
MAWLDRRCGTLGAFVALGVAQIAACQTGTEASPTPPPSHADAAAPPQQHHGLHWPAFHGDRARTGWNKEEPTLTPHAITRSGMALAWESAPFGEVTLEGATLPAHAYASLLYADDFPIGPLGGARLSVVFAATNNGDVCAIAAFDAQTSTHLVHAGSVLWRTRLAAPLLVPLLDGQLPLGVLGTPVLDPSATPARLYVVAIDASTGWSVYALDATTGAVLRGWPVVIDDASTNPVNRNGPSVFEGAAILSQRGALNLSADGATLYVPFGAYSDGGVGWMVAVDTAHPAVVAAHSSAPSTLPTAYGGIWSPGGSAIDGDGNLYAATGNSPYGSADAPHVWGQSLLQWRPTLELTGTYTPFNYCALDAADVDLGGSSPIILPDLDPSTTSTPQLLALGGKQGNVYLLDRAHLPGSVLARPPCSADSTTDGSLLPPGPQPQFGARGPLNVFGPYSEQYGNLNRGKMRTTPALFQKRGVSYLFVSGTAKAAVDSAQSVPPSVARLRVVTTPGAPAYLALDQADSTITMVNPGSPVVTSQGDSGVVVWVIDENAPRTASLRDANAPHPVLFAVDGTTMKMLWNSGQTLHVGGKYVTPVVAHGVVFVATDRVQAFALAKP